MLKESEQLWDCETEACDDPVGQGCEDQDAGKGCSFLPFRPIQRVIRIVRGLRNQDDIFLSFEMVRSCQSEWDFMIQRREIPSTKVTVPSEASNSWYERK